MVYGAKIARRRERLREAGYLPHSRESFSRAVLADLKTAWSKRFPGCGAFMLNRLQLLKTAYSGLKVEAVARQAGLPVEKFKSVLLSAKLGSKRSPERASQEFYKLFSPELLSNRKPPKPEKVLPPEALPLLGELRQLAGERFKGKRLVAGRLAKKVGELSGLNYAQVARLAGLNSDSLKQSITVAARSREAAVEEALREWARRKK